MPNTHRQRSIDTKAGPKFIESIQVGDLVRTRDPKTKFIDGNDDYQPIPKDVYRTVKEIVIAQCDSMMKMPFDVFQAMPTAYTLGAINPFA